MTVPGDPSVEASTKSQHSPRLRELPDAERPGTVGRLAGEMRGSVRMSPDRAGVIVDRDQSATAQSTIVDLPPRPNVAVTRRAHWRQ